MADDGRRGDDLESVVDALTLKDVPRTGWKLRASAIPYVGRGARVGGTAYRCLMSVVGPDVDVDRPMTVRGRPRTVRTNT